MGMAYDDIEQLVAHTKFDFIKRPAGERIISEGDRCNAIIILTHGLLQTEKHSDDHGYSVIETVKAPYIIQQEHLFGLTQRYSASFTTVSQCNFMSISKQEMMFLFEQFDVFRINYLNLLAAKTQKAQSRLWRPAPHDDRSRVAYFLASHCSQPTGPKEFRIIMNRLAAEINASRLDVSHTLNAMQRDGIIKLQRGRILIPEIMKIMA